MEWSVGLSDLKLNKILGHPQEVSLCWQHTIFIQGWNLGGLSVIGKSINSEEILNLTFLTTINY